MEQQPKSAEQLPRVEHEAQAALERLEASHEQLEAKPEQSDQIEAARRMVEQQPEPAKHTETHRHRPQASGLDRMASYRHTMRSVQLRLKPASRAFSKFIHNPPVERASEVLEVTILRPSVALGATLTALIVGSTFYYSASHYGFKLRGSEFVFSLFVGAILGYFLELIWKLLSRLFRTNR